MDYKMDYKIPEKVFNDFEYIGGRNYSTKDHKHIQTFAYLIGEEEGNDIVVTELIYPDQDGHPSYYFLIRFCKLFWLIINTKNQNDLNQ